MKYEKMTTKEQQAIRMGGPVPVVVEVDGRVVFKTETQDDGTEKVVVDELGDEVFDDDE